MLFKHILNLSLNFHLRRETGKILRVVNKGSPAFGDLVRVIIL
jgi:ABC-type transport system involved in Fe-S cluster assembly fused permease/ATPase subunit